MSRPCTGTARDFPYFLRIRSVWWLAHGLCYRIFWSVVRMVGRRGALKMAHTNSVLPRLRWYISNNREEVKISIVAIRNGTWPANVSVKWYLSSSSNCSNSTQICVPAVAKMYGSWVGLNLLRCGFFRVTKSGLSLQLRFRPLKLTNPL